MAICTSRLHLWRASLAHAWPGGVQGRAAARVGAPARGGHGGKGPGGDHRLVEPRPAYVFAMVSAGVRAAESRHGVECWRGRTLPPRPRLSSGSAIRPARLRVAHLGRTRLAAGSPE